MSITINTLSYDKDVQLSTDQIRYTGPSNSMSAPDYFDAKRTAPKPTAISAGWAKGEGKLTRALTDGTDPLGNGILRVASSIPVGTDRSEAEAMIDDMAAWMATANAKAVLLDGDVSH
jgi:hypothetical protein